MGHVPGHGVGLGDVHRINGTLSVSAHAVHSLSAADLDLRTAFAGARDRRTRSDGMKARTPIFGLLAEFAGPDELVAAARAVHGQGYRRLDAYSPFPIPGLSEAVGMRRTLLPAL